MIYKRYFNKKAGLLFFFCLLCGAGCWDAKELANLSLVSAVGIDLDEKQPGTVIVTIQIIKPGEMKSASAEDDSGKGGGSSSAIEKQQAYLMVSSSGKTVSEAFLNFINQVNRVLYLSHNLIVVFSGQAAKKGISPFLDFFIRARQTRETVWILVADGKASDVIETSIGQEKIPAFAINGLISNWKLNSQADGVTQHDFMVRLLGKGAAPYAPFIQVINNSGEKKLSLGGTAIFKEDKFIGRYDKSETRGMLWVVNKVNKGLISIKPANQGSIDFEIIKAKSKMKPEIKEGKIRVKLEIDIECGLTNEMKSLNLLKQQTVRSLEFLVCQAVKDEVKAALNKAFRLGSDVFGFGEAIHRKFPKEWKKIKPVWNRKFSTVEVNITCETRLKSSGVISKSVYLK